MNEKVLYYSQNGRHLVAAVNHAGVQGALMTITTQQAHQVVSFIRRQLDDPDVLKQNKPMLSLDEFGWWATTIGCPDRVEEIVYPDGWKQDEQSVPVPKVAS